MTMKPAYPGNKENSLITCILVVSLSTERSPHCLVRVWDVIGLRNTQWRKVQINKSARQIAPALSLF